jgi:ketosteroid isomerase-like protein
MTAKELFVEAMRRTDAGDIDGFVALHAPDCTWITPSAELHGHDELRGWLAPWLAGFPSERRHELTRVVEIDGTVYCEGVFHGVNAGAMETPEGTLPATGKTLAMPFAIVVEIDVDAGHATGVHVYFDQLGFLGQLGLLPAPAAA